MAERVCLGRIGAPHGVRGLVRVQTFTDNPEDLLAWGPLTDADGKRRFELEIAGRSKDRLLARIAGVADRDAAGALRGVELYVERSALPAPGDEEYYQADLIGLTAADKAGRSLGTVRAVHDFGAGPVLELAPEEGPTTMVPFNRAVVPGVDIAGGRLLIDAPPGLLDDGTEADDSGKA